MRDKKIGLLSITLMGIMSIYSLINIPVMARYGASSAIYYLIAALIFFIPSALVCAELASGWPIAGGVYVWIKEAFGDVAGRICMWLEWINNTLVFPASLSFTVSIMYHLYPGQIQFSKYATLCFMLLFFWAVTFINFRGIRYSSRLSNLGFLFGTLLPCLLIIVFGVWWYFEHIPHYYSALSNSTPKIFDAHILMSSFLISVIMGYSGIQSIAFHAQDVKKPQKTYPLAIFIICIVTLCLYVFSTLAIFAVVPTKSINIIDGLVQALEAFFKEVRLISILPLIIFLIVLGRLSSLSMWVIGPARGLAAARGYSDSAKNVSYVNKHGAPRNILLIQALITTFLSSFYVFVPNATDMYWVFLATSTVFTLIMYMLIFAAAIALRYLQPGTPRVYKVPCGIIGMWVISGCGFIISFLVFILCFIPPENLYFNTSIFYKGLIAVGLVALTTLPIIINFKKKNV